MKLSLCILFLLSFTCLNSEAQAAARFDFSSLPDTQEARARYLSSVVTANLNSAVRFSETYLPSSAGRIQISVDKQDDFFYVRFLREQNGKFPLVSPGNTIVQRNYLRNGDLIQAKLFLMTDPSSYIRLYPHNERTKADIVIYGTVVKKGIILPQIFYYQLRDPVSRIITTTERVFDWSLLYRAPGLETVALRFCRALRDNRVNGSSPGARLVSSLVSGETAEIFLAGCSHTPGVAELTESLPLPFADDSDPLRTSEYKSFPNYEPERGVPLPAVAALVHTESLKNADNMIAAFIQNGSYAKRLLFLAGFDEIGVFCLETYDPDSRTFIDWPEFVAAHRASYARLVVIPAPHTF